MSIRYNILNNNFKDLTDIDICFSDDYISNVINKTERTMMLYFIEVKHKIINELLYKYSD